MTAILNKISGEFNLVVTKPDGSTYETGWFSNIITNAGFDRMMAASNTMTVGYATVGTGTSAPTATQNALDNKIGGTSATWSNITSSTSGNPSYIATHTFTFVFTQGAVVGNITEVGIGWASTGPGSLWSRALTLDNSGSPITLTLTSIDQLTIYYRVSIAPTVTDTTGTVVISGTPVNYTIRLGNAASFTGVGSWAVNNNSSGPFAGSYLFPAYPNINTYGGTVALPALTAPNMTATTVLNEQPARTSPAYVNGTYYTDTTWSWGASLANHTGGSLSGITMSWGINSYISYHILFGTPILKTNSKTLTLTTRLAWSR